MKTIHKILNLYLNKKLENQTIGFLLNFSFVFILHLVILIMIEQNAFLEFEEISDLKSYKIGYLLFVEILSTFLFSKMQPFFFKFL